MFLNNRNYLKTYSKTGGTTLPVSSGANKWALNTLLRNSTQFIKITLKNVTY